jgi:hypothetical protein
MHNNFAATDFLYAPFHEAFEATGQATVPGGVEIVKRFGTAVRVNNAVVTVRHAGIGEFDHGAKLTNR